MKTLFSVSTFSMITLLSSAAMAQDSGGWWGQELAGLPGLLGGISAAGQQDGPGIMDDLEDNESVRLSDDHWQITHEMADLDGDGSVSLNELTGMLEGGKLRAPEPAGGWTDVYVADLRDDDAVNIREGDEVEMTGGATPEGTASGLTDVSVADVTGSGSVGIREGDEVEVVSQGLVADSPEGYEAVSLEQGLVDSPFSVLSARVEARFVQADQNGDGGVDLAELTQLRRDYMAAHGKQANANRAQKQARRIMGRIDSNGDRMISREELAASRGNRMMQRLDSDGDGQISQAEWAVTLR